MADRPRVLMVVTFLDDPGGVQKQARLQARTLRAMGVEVQCVTARRSGRPAEETVDGMPVHRLPFLDRWRIGNLKFRLLNRRLRTWMRAHADTFDVVHVHQGLWTAAGAASAARALGKPCVVKIGNTGERFDLRVLQRGLFFGKGTVRGLIRDATRFVATSAQAAGELETAGVPAEKIARIANGVCIPNCPPGPDPAARRTLGVRDTDVLFLSVGSLTLHKRPMLSLVGFMAAAREYPHAKLWFLGDGVLAGWLDRQVEELNAGGRVVRHGRVDDVGGYLRAADAFVLPSAVEGMSNALLEAMAHGLACIATDVSGSRDLIDDGRNGLLVPVDDIKALTRAIGRLLDAPSLRTRLGAAARETVEQQCAIDAVCRKYIDLYEELTVQ